MSDTVVETKSNRPRYIVLAVFLVIVALVVVLSTRPAANSEVVASPLVGQPAPNITGTALDGREVDLSELKGRYVVVNFFATWCGPCLQEHPEIAKFYDSNRGPGDPTVLSVAFKDADSNVRNFFRDNNGNWPVLADPDGKVSVEYGIRGLPESYIVNPEGNIAAHVTGALDEAALNRLTANT